MSIDWITVLAQIINLIVLALILKKLLYKPVLNMIDQRQALIDGEIQKAQDAAKKAKEDADAYAEQIRLFKAEKQERLQRIETEAQTLQTTLTTEIKKSVAARKKQWETNLTQEKEAFNRELRDKIAQQFIVLARQVFKDMANTTLQEQMQACFLKKLANLPKRAHQKLVEAALKEKQIKVVVALPGSAQQTKALKAQIKKILHLPTSVRITTETKARDICGLSLVVKDECINWNLADYLDTLSHNVNTHLEIPEA